jgi:hypothetical protein
MNPTLVVVGSLIVLVFDISAFAFAKERDQLLGAVLLVMVVFTHVAETFHLFPSMGWVFSESPGHYIDLISAVGGLILLPTG